MCPALVNAATRGGAPRIHGGFEGTTEAALEADGRGERIRTSGLYVPNVALYQAKLHPEGQKGADVHLSGPFRDSAALELPLDRKVSQL